jgi:hypothetical protein
MSLRGAWSIRVDLMRWTMIDHDAASSTLGTGAALLPIFRYPASPLLRGVAPKYSQIDDNYSQFDYNWETGCVAAVVSAPVLWSAGAPHPVPPGVRRAGHPSQEGTCGWRIWDWRCHRPPTRVIARSMVDHGRSHEMDHKPAPCHPPSSPRRRGVGGEKAGVAISCGLRIMSLRGAWSIS